MGVFDVPPVESDSGESIRYGRPSTPPGFTGGGAGGGISGLGGGFSGGSGGFSAQTHAGFGSTGFASQAQKKRYYTNGSGTSVSTSPVGYAYGGPVAKPSDSIPAKLTPGEFVVNRTAAQKPENAMALERMNQQGLQEGGYQDAYSAPDGSSMHEGMEAQSPGLSREALVELLSVLLSGQQDDGYGLGGWVGKHKGLLLGLGAAALPFALPALAGLAGAGGATASAGAAAGASGVGSVAVPATMHTVNTGLLGTLVRTAQMHPGLMKAGTALYGVGQEQQAAQQANRQREDEEGNIASANYQNARARSEADSGYAMGGPVFGNRPVWAGSPFGGGAWARGSQTGAMGGQMAMGRGQAAAGGPQGVSTEPGIGQWRQNYVGQDPGTLNAMNEAGARDANDYASGVGRQAVLADADPGAQAAYRLRALAGASRGVADRLSTYRTDMAGKDLEYRRALEASNSGRAFDLEKQRIDAYNQEKLKRIH